MAKYGSHFLRWAPIDDYYLVFILLCSLPLTPHPNIVLGLISVANNIKEVMVCKLLRPDHKR